MDKDQGTTVKLAPTGAVVGLWWSAVEPVDTCSHPADQQIYMRLINANKPEFYQEYCARCGKVIKQIGEYP